MFYSSLSRRISRVFYCVSSYPHLHHCHIFQRNGLSAFRKREAALISSYNSPIGSMDLSPVEVDGGFIKGEILTNELNNERYYSFRGVPYACPPVGSLRFQPPKCVQKWDGVMECMEDKEMCPQKPLFSIDGLSFEGSEDCLYLNIFFPVENRSKSLRPVMVFIHGGGFTMGSADSHLYGPDYLVAKEVVLVTMNYRLNIFGFLNLGIEECPGNVGLLDQRAALIWVKKHIQKFSGDPENITIFGESAGSASVHYHLLSPLSKGLYHKAILQSGCSLDPWAYMDTSLCIDRAFRVGEYLGCKTTDVKELHKFLLNVPPLTLTEAVFPILTTDEKELGLGLPFVPSKEIIGAPKDRFLPDDPRVLLTNASKVPILCGLTSAEGLIFYLEGPKILPRILQDIGSALEKRFPKDLRNVSTDLARIEAAQSKVRQFYTRGDSASESVVANIFADFFGDVMFGRGNHLLLKSYLSSPQREPFYLYMYDFESNASLIKNLGNLPRYFKGACHGDELMFLFNFKVFNSFVFESEAGMYVVELLTTIWTNFAKFGNPNPNGELKIKWEPISPNKVSHCKIDKELKIQPGLIHEERIRFWNELSLSLLNQSKL